MGYWRVDWEWGRGVGVKEVVLGKEGEGGGLIC